MKTTKPTKKLSAELPRELYAALVVHKAKTEMTISDVVNAALRKYLSVDKKSMPEKAA